MPEPWRNYDSSDVFVTHILNDDAIKPHDNNSKRKREANFSRENIFRQRPEAHENYHRRA